MEKSNKLKKILSPIIFVLTFVLPVLIFYGIIKFFTSPKIEIKESKFGKKTFSVKLPGESVRVFDEDLLNPKENKDFILTSWFKFRKLPKDGEKVILITKYDATTAYKQGYALAIEKNSSTGFRGSVFWQDINNNGRWYTFGEIPLVPGTWFMFTVSFTSNKHLAFHYTYELNNEVVTKLIGAYKVSALPASKSSFRVGSLITQLFDGRVGTISIINSSNTEKNLEDLIKANFDSPQNIPSIYKDDEVIFWTVGGENDLSKNSLKVLKVGKSSKAKNKNDIEQDSEI